MFNNYRRKQIFSHLDDESLQAYVDSLACCRQTGDVELCYPPAWEARIYATGVRADLDIWRNLGHLDPPVLILRGSGSDTFSLRTWKEIKMRLPRAEMITIPNTTHLVPLENPFGVYEAIMHFLQHIGQNGSIVDVIPKKDHLWN